MIIHNKYKNYLYNSDKFNEVAKNHNLHIKIFSSDNLFDVFYILLISETNINATFIAKKIIKQIIDTFEIISVFKSNELCYQSNDKYMHRGRSKDRYYERERNNTGERSRSRDRERERRDRDYGRDRDKRFIDNHLNQNSRYFHYNLNTNDDHVQFKDNIIKTKPVKKRDDETNIIEKLKKDNEKLLEEVTKMKAIAFVNSLTNNQNNTTNTNYNNTDGEKVTYELSYKPEENNKSDSI
jgi:hypothetical protein